MINIIGWAIAGTLATVRFVLIQDYIGAFLYFVVWFVLMGLLIIRY